jgi:hypothetical protein
MNPLFEFDMPSPNNALNVRSLSRPHHAQAKAISQQTSEPTA